MKIYLNKINEDWVVDRFINEWKKYNKDITTSSLIFSDVVWIIAPWTWKKINKFWLKQKKVICTIHHIDENSRDLEDFYERDKYVSEYITISQKTKEVLSKFTNKKITSIPFWINQNIFFELENREELRKKYGFNPTDYLVGSFQRDSEGLNPKNPKLIKGPDLFINIVKNMSDKKENLKIVLTGQRRDYITTKLEENNINYSLFKMVDFIKLNELYNILDLYVVSSRIEGGPQAILECGITKTPIVSTDVGIASEILSPESIYDIENFDDAKVDIEYAYKKSVQYSIPKGINRYRKYFLKLNAQ